MADVKQANRKISDAPGLHDELGRLLDDLRRWARLLVDEDEELGISPLGRMPSAAGRTPPNLFPAPTPAEEVRGVLLDLLNRLSTHLDAAVREQTDEAARSVLAGIADELAGHRQALRG